MGKELVAKGQVTITTLDEAFHASQSVDEYVFPASSDGTITSALTVVSTIQVTQGNNPYTAFTIGNITKPSGFSSITIDNTRKTITYVVAANTTTLAAHGSLNIPLLMPGITYNLTFRWAKAVSGSPGSNGKDGYTVKSSRQGCTIPTDENGRIHTAVTVSTVISVLRGTVAVTPIIGTLPTLSGCSMSKSGTTVTFVFNPGTSLAEQGVIDLPVTADGITFNVPFSFAKARAGATGSPGTDSNLLDWVNDWNTNKTQINSTTVITPKIFAGAKNSDGTLTGMAIGRFALSVKNASGSVVTETVDGIYGFRNGYKTFFVDNGGNVQLGQGDQFIKYNSSTGRIEFGAGVSLNWTNAISQAKTETLNAATSTAQGKADAALASAKGYTDTKKGEAVTEAGKNADSKISTLTATLNTSIADAKKAGTDARAVADALTSKATSEGWSTKLTYIDANGIFTGTLSANTVNTLRLNASQITAGTIATSRLNTTELKATLITAANIQALTLNVTKGTIGGWAINSNTLSGGQIVLDKANKRIAVFGASSSATSGHRVQLYYNSNTDFGLYATNSAGTIVAQIGSMNRIAGWIFDNAQIYKNSVYLGSDGSIYNGTKWRLNKDGSGRIANGNILWDSTGNVTFGDSVSLKWKNDIEAAKTANFGYRYYKRIVINGESGKYYPVILKGGDQTAKRDILIRRGYSEQAPSDWDNNSSTHMGGLILLLKANFGGWGGASYSWDIYELSECYSRMFAGAVHCGNSCMFAIFLRGGGTTGAVYHIYSNQTLENGAYSPSPIPPAPQIAYNSDQIFLSGSHTAYAPAPRTLTSSVEEEIRRHRFITLTQSNDTTLTQHPLTYIGSTGIYTGTLTAAQVNAVAINAGSITTGTLSADRIAAGSIHSTKLDAASIKANIINVSYINGLSCTFVRGRIGGWTIGADNITAGNIGTVGAMPIQIRSAASGSGYWYTGAYKPLGITMTWHQSNNAGHVVFGQIAASGSTVRSGFLGIQMMSWDGLEYFCLSANYTRSGSKEVYNRIAGWAFDNNHIYKNNVSLGADGSIVNGTRWKLNNDGSASFGSGKVVFNTDGSGRVANGKFSWDASGNIVAQGGSFKDVTIQGTIRSAFVENDPSIWITVGGGTTSGVQTDPVHYDNVVCTQTGGWNENINLPWTLENSGRRICLVNYKWGSTISTGYMTITAPSGKYFFEDGISKSTLKFSREVIEMIGYGDSSTFFGWIVLNRRDLMTSGRYGSFQQILVSGIVTGTKSSASIRYHTFDGSTSVSVSRLGQGMYRVYLPSSWGLASKYMVMATGIYSTAENTPIYPTVKAIYSYYFDIYTQDDASRNDGSFNFQVFSTNNWDH